MSVHRVRHVARGPRPDAGAERGETLVELIVAIILMATAIVALLTAAVTMVVTSAANRGAVRTGNEAAIVAGLIASTDTPYQPCTASTSPSYDAVFDASSDYAHTTEPAGYDVEITPGDAVLYLHDKLAATPAFDATCPAGGDQGVQQMTVTVTADSGGKQVHESVTFVKRKP
ncbi:MAG TPA: hypothetical protein VGM93_02070 [Acidimicrobiales bacterium]